MKEIVNRLHENRQIQLAKEILESNGYNVSKNSKRLKESTVTDFIDSDTLYDIMNSTKEFGSFSHYRVLDNMIVKTTKSERYSDIGPYGAVDMKDRYWKFTKNPEGWEVYEVTSEGKKIGDSFLV